MNIKDHYNHQASFYSWMTGDFKEKTIGATSFFSTANAVVANASKVAIEKQKCRTTKVTEEDTALHKGFFV